MARARFKDADDPTGVKHNGVALESEAGYEFPRNAMEPLPMSFFLRASTGGSSRRRAGGKGISCRSSRKEALKVTPLKGLEEGVSFNGGVLGMTIHGSTRLAL